jgi:hypothetical protein
MVSFPIVIPPVVIQVYRWAGERGSFKVNIICGEISLTYDIIIDTIETGLKGIPVELDMRVWHAPVVIVEEKNQ